MIAITDVCLWCDEPLTGLETVAGAVVCTDCYIANGFVQPVPPGTTDDVIIDDCMLPKADAVMTVTAAALRLVAFMPTGAERATVLAAAGARTRQRGGRAVSRADVAAVLSHDALIGLDDWLAGLPAPSEVSR